MFWRKLHRPDAPKHSDIKVGREHSVFFWRHRAFFEEADIATVGQK
jgi:hypothetical protein